MIARLSTTTRDLWLGRPGRVVPIFLGVVLANSVNAGGQEAGGKSGWVSLFNGKDLEGWIPKVKGYEAGEITGTRSAWRTGC